MGDRPGTQNIENVGFIMKEPGRLDAMANITQGLSRSGGLGGLSSLGALGAGGFQPPIVAAGMIGMPGTVECGYQPAVQITPIELSRHVLRYRVSADLFDPMLMMSAGGSTSGCAALQNMHVEFADFEISLPFGLFYESDTSITGGTPDGQDVYDETDFFDGPNFGGILSSMSIVGAAGTTQPPENETTDEGFTPQTVLAQTLTFTGLGPFEPKTIHARTIQFTGLGPRTIQARTLEFTGLGLFEPKTIHARTLQFTGLGPRTIQARTLKFTGLGLFETVSVSARTLEFTGTESGQPECSCTCASLALPKNEACHSQCPLKVASCGISETVGNISTPTSGALVPTVDAQVTYLKRLITDQGLTEEVELMLLGDFAIMSDETRAYLIRRYRRGYE